MPCRDDTPDTYWSELRERNDELAAELCKARGLLLTLSMVLDHNTVTNSIVRDVQDQLEKHRQHRDLDKHRAISTVESKKSNIVDKISKIRALGGLPSPTLLEEIDVINTELQRFRDSDSLETDLY